MGSHIGMISLSWSDSFLISLKKSHLHARLAHPTAITGVKVCSHPLKSVQTAAQAFPLGILALDVKSQEGIWDAQQRGVQMAFY